MPSAHSLLPLPQAALLQGVHEISGVLINRQAPDLHIPPAIMKDSLHADHHDMTGVDTGKLTGIVYSLTSSQHPLRRSYGLGIKGSILAHVLDRQSNSNTPTTNNHMSSDQTARYREEFWYWEEQYHSTLRGISSALVPISISEVMLARGGMWPQVTLRGLLAVMSYASGWNDLNQQWKVTLAKLGIALLRYQHARRILFLSLRYRDDEIVKEMSGQDMSIQDVIQHPDWLLIQVSHPFLELVRF